MTATSREIAEKLADRWSMQHHVQAVSDLTAALEEREREGYLRGIEDAVNQCVEHADGYRRLRAMAREASDLQDALSHLCEEQSAILLAQDIRALAQKDVKP